MATRMNQEEFVKNLVAKAESLLIGAITGHEFVRSYDELMAERRPLTMAQEIYDVLGRYHIEFALYVENPEWRTQSTSYYGPAQLRDKIQAFVRDLKTAISARKTEG